MIDFCLECPEARRFCWLDCPLLHEYFEIKAYDEGGFNH